MKRSYILLVFITLYVIYSLSSAPFTADAAEEELPEITDDISDEN